MVENTMAFFKNLKLELPYNPAVPLLVVYPREIMSVCHRNICTPTCTAGLFMIAKKQNQPTDEWMREMWYIHNGILCSIEKGGIVLFAATWMSWRS